MGLLGNLLSGTLSGLTMPSSTAQYTGGYDPGTNGMVDPGVNGNQSVGPSWQNMQQNPKWNFWDNVFNGGQGRQFANQANVAGQQEMLQRSLGNQDALSQQNNVLPYQLSSIAPNMLSKAQTGLDSGTLANLLSGSITRGQLPFGSAMGSSGAGANISGNLMNMAQNANSTAQAQGAAPYQNELGKIMSMLQLGNAGVDLTKAGQTNQFLQQNPSYIPTTMEQQREQQLAEINRANRQQGFPGAPTVTYGSDNKPTGSVIEQMTQYDMTGIPHKVTPAPVYQSMGPKTIPAAEVNSIINPSTPQMTPSSPTNTGIASGGVGRQGNNATMDINSLLRDPQVQAILRQAIQSQMPKQGGFSKMGSAIDNFYGSTAEHPSSYRMGH